MTDLAHFDAAEARSGKPRHASPARFAKAPGNAGGKIGFEN
jgi:hypothetical protein